MKFGWSLLLIVGVAGLLHADIAPTRYFGSAVVPSDRILVPIRNLEVSMASAEVVITWGEPCRLEATFVLVNDSTETKSLELGFPVGAFRPEFDDLPELVAAGLAGMDETFAAQTNPETPAHEESLGDEAIVIQLRGASLSAYSRVPVEAPPEMLSGEALWYFARAELVPGENRVEVVTRLKASEVRGQPDERCLNYCIWTGGRWDGPIGRETVTIRFPGSEAAALVRQAVPTGATVSGDHVQWVFESIEPESDEFDIVLRFVPPLPLPRKAH